MKKVIIGGLKQNCYVKDVLTGTRDIKKFETQKTYESLERKKLPNGYTEEIEVKDYPINSESVTSYADGADYRNDPLQAIANAPKRTNLGDVTELQNFLNGQDPQAVIRTYKDVISKLEAYAKAQEELKVQGQGEGVTPAPVPANN